MRAQADERATSVTWWAMISPPADRQELRVRSPQVCTYLGMYIMQEASRRRLMTRPSPSGAVGPQAR